MTPTRNAYADLASVLAASLDLRQPPLAICFTDAPPAGVSEYAGRVPAGCRFWEDGAQKAFLTSASDHKLCSIGMYTHHLESLPAQQADLQDALRVFAELDYVTPADVAAIPVLADRPAHIVYAPLASSPLPPQVVLLFVDARQALIVSEAAQQVDAQNAPAMGRPACAVVPQLVNTGRAALSLGCCGARAYLDVLEEGVSVFAIPGDKLEAYTGRIAVLARANAVLSAFHQSRRKAVDAGLTPSIAESLAALK